MPQPVDAVRLRMAVRFGLLGMLLACLSRVTAVDHDLFHELSLIRELFRTGHLPTVDPFAWTPTVRPLVHHEWGTGLIVYLAAIASGLGGSGLILLTQALSLGIAAGCCVCARRRGAAEPVISLFAPLALVMLSVGLSTVRAQVFTLACLTGLMLLLAEESRNRRKWWIPAWLCLYVVWLNLHAGFLAGLGLFGVYLLERFLRECLESRSLLVGARRIAPLAGCLLAMLPLALINPYGADYVAYLSRAVLMPRPDILEWRSLWSAGAWGLIVALGFSLLIAAYAIAQRGLRPLEGIGMVAITALMALQHSRHLSLYAVVWMCVVPAWLEATPLAGRIASWGEAFPRWALAFWLACGLGGTGYAVRQRFWEVRVPTMPADVEAYGSVYPAGAVDYLAGQRFQGNLLVPFNFGAYVTWKLYPAVRVSSDSRYEVAYPPGQVERLEAIFRCRPGWEATLREYPPDAVLVPWWSSLEEPLYNLEGPGGARQWQRLYRDDAFTLFLRRDLAEGLPILRHHGKPIQGTFP